MAFNFPNTPTDGQIFTDATSGAQYVYKSGVWMQSSAAQIKIPTLAENLIVNPAFNVSQENGVNEGTTTNFYFADEWMVQLIGIAAGGKTQNDGGKTTGQIRNTAAKASLAATDFLAMTHPIEGYLFNSLQWGQTSVPQVPAVLNFKAKASAVGTYGGSLRESNAGTGAFPFTFQITTANVWQEFTIPIPAPPAGSNFMAGTALGGYIQLCHSVGSNYVAPSNRTWQSGQLLSGPGITNNSAVSGTTLQIADVQLLPDPDSTGAAPTFVVPDYPSELLRCQRYYYRNAAGAVGAYITSGYASGAGGAAYGSFDHPVQMRAAPSMTFINTSTSNVSGGAMPVGAVDQWSFRVSCSASGIGTLYVVFGPIGNARMI